MRLLICLLLAPLWALSSPAHAAPPFEDSMAQRTLACAGCHGKEGRAGPDGYYPRIAGKPAGYLYNQLLNFRDGRRHYGLMVRLLDPLSDAYLLEIAQHFAALDLPYAAPRPATLPTALLQRGETLARHGDASKNIPACVQCHGDALTGALPNTPGLLGLSRDYLNAQLGAWRTGQRRAHAPDCMARIAQQLSPEDLTAAAAWLSAQPLPRDTRATASLPRPPAISCGSAMLPAGRQQP
jgi:cytochrome c553